MTRSTSEKRRSTASGDETRARIIDATLKTLKSDGIVGMSARVIAKEGDFNQALIFYHFGSLDALVGEAVAEMSRRRMQRHEGRLAQVDSLVELIQIARELHADDTVADNMTVLTQAFAGASGHPDLGPKLYAQLQPWCDMVADTLRRVVADVPGGDVLPHEQLAKAISALFLGVELLDDLDPTRADVGALFDALEGLARMFESLMQTPLLQAFAEASAESGASTA